MLPCLLLRTTVVVIVIVIVIVIIYFSEKKLTINVSRRTTMSILDLPTVCKTRLLQTHIGLRS